MLAATLMFALFMLLPANFEYPLFAALLLGSGLAQGLFSSPNTAAIMNSVPPADRGAASGTRATFLNAGLLLSMSLFFSLLIVGMAGSLPETLSRGLIGHGVPAAAAGRVSTMAPVATLFAALLGFNPIATLLGPALQHLPAGEAAYLTGRAFFPQLIAAPFLQGVRAVLVFSVVVSLLGAWASWLRGGRYVYVEREKQGRAADPAPPRRESPTAVPDRPDDG